MCYRPITEEQARIEVDGAHEHTFANPHGYIHHIGCFSTAPGTVPVLDESDEFPWFAGHTWQIVVCGRCGAQLGWRFRSRRGRFHGLLLERLVPEQRGEQP